MRLFCMFSDLAVAVVTSVILVKFVALVATEFTERARVSTVPLVMSDLAEAVDGSRPL